jgi:hypothetical protein
MSGQPLQKVGDAKKFRDVYMATLQLQADINRKNFDANALYKRTGVVPTEILDYRSTSEKLADLLNLKIMLRSKLRQIADARNAEDIAHNLSSDQLVFVSQRIDAIIKDLKPKYKFGIPTDIFMAYVGQEMKKAEYDVLKVNSLTTDGINEATDEPPTDEQLKYYDAVEDFAPEPSEAGATDVSTKSTREADTYDLTIPLPPIPLQGEKEKRQAYLNKMFGPSGFFTKFGTGGKGQKAGGSILDLIKIVKTYVNAGAIENMPNTKKIPLMEALVENWDDIERLYELKAEGGAGEVGGAEGEGLRRKIKGRGVDYTKGIEPLQKYAPLGQYYINQQKLKDDIITCCRADGRNVGEWKARRVSLPLANLVRKLVNKGKPTFDDLNELNEEDKHTLAEFIRRAKLDLDIPNSKIDREDLNQFEIMKGQIMAGNDSTELIKKFKLLIVKLCNDGRLPKGQGKGILLDLASLGY